VTKTNNIIAIFHSWWIAIWNSKDLIR